MLLLLLVEEHHHRLAAIALLHTDDDTDCAMGVEMLSYRYIYTVALGYYFVGMLSEEHRQAKSSAVVDL